jgi:hypothetical protein
MMTEMSHRNDSLPELVKGTPHGHRGFTSNLEELLCCIIFSNEVIEISEKTTNSSSCSHFFLGIVVQKAVFNSTMAIIASDENFNTSRRRVVESSEPSLHAH